MTDIKVPVDARLTLRLSFNCNARYSALLFKLNGSGWTNAPIQADAVVVGEGDVQFALEPIAAGSRWAVVVGANMTPTEESGDVSCDAQLLLGDDVKGAVTASGKVANGADGGYLPGRIRFDVIAA